MCNQEADPDEKLSNTEGLEGEETLKGKRKIKKKRKRKISVVPEFAENTKGIKTDVQNVKEKPVPLASKVNCALLNTNVTTVEECGTYPCNSSFRTQPEDANFSRKLLNTETDPSIKKKKKVNRNPRNGSIDADASTTVEHFTQENLISSSLQSLDTAILRGLTKDHSNRHPEGAPEKVDKEAPSSSSVPLVKGKKHRRKQGLDNGSSLECAAALELLDTTRQRTTTEKEVGKESLKSILPAEADVCSKVERTLLSDKDHRMSTDDKTNLSLFQAESAELVIKENIDKNNQASIIPCTLESRKRNHKKKKDKRNQISLADKNLGSSEDYPSTTTLNSSEPAVNDGALKQASDELCKSRLIHDVSDGENLENQRKQGTYLPSVNDVSYLENISCLTHKENNSLEKLADLHIARPLSSHPRRKLLILDLNGLLANAVDIFKMHEPPPRKADKKIGRKLVFKRPFCDEFLEFCFRRFDVGIWSSLIMRNLQPIVEFLLGNMRNKLLFCWDASFCTKTGLYTIDNRRKPLVLKELKKIWEKEWEKVQYTPSCTLLVDDSPYKALCNPAYTGVFPRPFMLHNEDDDALGRGGKIRSYLRGLVKADDVREYVKNKPFGQRAITSDHPDWDFYKRVLVSRGRPHVK